MDKKQYSFIQFRESMNLPNGIYNGRYNSEPSIIRMEDGIPVFVSFIGFIKHYEGEDQLRSACIYDPKGILHSSVELLLPAQEFNLSNILNNGQ
jgi:hypothetical protein